MLDSHEFVEKIIRKIVKVIDKSIKNSLTDILNRISGTNKNYTNKRKIFNLKIKIDGFKYNNLNNK